MFSSKSFKDYWRNVLVLLSLLLHLSKESSGEICSATVYLSKHLVTIGLWAMRVWKSTIASVVEWNLNVVSLTPINFMCYSISDGLLVFS